jgi:hypothetical protein
MENAIFDEHKGVYRVNNVDGTFETYTPAQFAELGGEVSIEEEEADIILNSTATEPVITSGESTATTGGGIMRAIKNVLN